MVNNIVIIIELKPTVKSPTNRNKLARIPKIMINLLNILFLNITNEFIKTESITVLRPAICVTRNNIIAINDKIKTIIDHILLDFLKDVLSPKHKILKRIKIIISNKFNPCIMSGESPLNSACNLKITISQLFDIRESKSFLFTNQADEVKLLIDVIINNNPKIREAIHPMKQNIFNLKSGKLFSNI
jgi:hypothetical protein